MSRQQDRSSRSSEGSEKQSRQGTGSNPATAEEKKEKPEPLLKFRIPEVEEKEAYFVRYPDGRIEVVKGEDLEKL